MVLAIVVFDKDAITTVPDSGDRTLHITPPLDCLDTPGGGFRISVCER